MNPQTAVSHWLITSPERLDTVVDDITQGSEPGATFYALLIAAAMIACFGLVANSTAVIIGAMLVSPLMTPIFGIALGMLRGDARLFWRATAAEFAGVVLAVGSAYLFGMVPVVTEATSEMLSRTQPNLIDLLVALFAGFAGAYALVDERVSPALPGVAIATAIVPPLSTAGLCLAMGGWAGATGALVLFLANFVTILLVALMVFTAAGMAPAVRWTSTRQAVSRYGLAVAGFLVIATILTQSLLRIIHDRHTQEAIEQTLSESLAEREGAVLGDVVYHAHQGSLYVMAHARSPGVIRPGRVKTMQEALEKRLGLPVELIVRTTLAKDVVATGALTQAKPPDFDGVFFSSELTDDEKTVRRVEQVLFDLLQAEPGVVLLDVALAKTESHRLALASVRSIRDFAGSEIERYQDAIRSALGDPDFLLKFRYSPSVLIDDEGTFLIGWTDLSEARPEDFNALKQLKERIREETAKLPDTFPVGVHVNLREGVCRVLVEVVGPRAIEPEQAAAVEAAVKDASPWPVTISIWHKADSVVSADGYTTYEDFTRSTLEERIRQLPEVFGEDFE